MDKTRLRSRHLHKKLIVMVSFFLVIRVKFTLVIITKVKTLKIYSRLFIIDIKKPLLNGGVFNYFLFNFSFHISINIPRFYTISFIMVLFTTPQEDFQFNQTSIICENPVWGDCKTFYEFFFQFV